jgi:hypothetical protein
LGNAIFLVDLMAGSIEPIAHVESRHVEDAHQLGDVSEIEGVLRVILRNDEQVARFRTDLLDGGLRGLHRERQHLLGEIVPAAREKIGVDRGQLEARVADVDRAVERRRVLHPFEPEPALDGGRGVEYPLLQFVDRAGQGGDEMRNHAAALLVLYLKGRAEL